MTQSDRAKVTVVPWGEKLPEAIAVALDSHSPSLYRTSDWYRLFVEHAREPDDRFVAVCEWDSDQAVGVLPLAIRTRRRGPIRWRRAEALGNYYTLDYGPAGAAGLTHGVASALRGLDVAEFALEPLHEREAQAVALRLSEAGLHPRLEPAFVNWTLPCADLRFDAFESARPSHIRNTWARRRRRLERTGMTVRFELHRGFGLDLDRAVEAWVDVYRDSWKSPEAHPRFVPELIRLAARRGWLRLGLLRIAGKTAAAQMWLVDQGRATIYKLAHVESMKEFSPGLLLTMEMFRHALEVDRVSVVDFGSGDDPYKADWMTTRTLMWRVSARNPRNPLGLVASWGDALRASRDRVGSAVGRSGPQQADVKT